MANSPVVDELTSAISQCDTFIRDVSAFFCNPREHDIRSAAYQLRSYLVRLKKHVEALRPVYPVLNLVSCEDGRLRTTMRVPHKDVIRACRFPLSKNSGVGQRLQHLEIWADLQGDVWFRELLSSHSISTQGTRYPPHGVELRPRLLENMEAYSWTIYTLDEERTKLISVVESVSNNVEPFVGFETKASFQSAIKDLIKILVDLKEVTHRDFHPAIFQTLDKDESSCTSALQDYLAKHFVTDKLVKLGAELLRGQDVVDARYGFGLRVQLALIKDAVRNVQGLTHRLGKGPVWHEQHEGMLAASRFLPKGNLAGSGSISSDFKDTRIIQPSNKPRWSLPAQKLADEEPSGGTAAASSCVSQPTIKDKLRVCFSDGLSFESNTARRVEALNLKEKALEERARLLDEKAKLIERSSKLNNKMKETRLKVIEMSRDAMVDCITEGIKHGDFTTLQAFISPPDEVLAMDLERKLRKTYLGTSQIFGKTLTEQERTAQATSERLNQMLKQKEKDYYEASGDLDETLTAKQRHHQWIYKLLDEALEMKQETHLRRCRSMEEEFEGLCRAHQEKMKQTYQERFVTLHTAEDKEKAIQMAPELVDTDLKNQRIFSSRTGKKPLCHELETLLYSKDSDVDNVDLGQDGDGNLGGCTCADYAPAAAAPPIHYNDTWTSTGFDDVYGAGHLTVGSPPSCCATLGDDEAPDYTNLVEGAEFGDFVDVEHSPISWSDAEFVDRGDRTSDIDAESDSSDEGGTVLTPSTTSNETAEEV